MEVRSDSGRRFVIRELGLRETIDGVLIEPTAECEELNVDALAEQPAWELRGEWFPYELFADGFVFVIDDDGSVFVSTANLPTEFREKALELIRIIAEILYEP